MQRIDGTSAAPARPAPGAVVGTPGFFTEGDPAVPTPPTIVTPDWLNAVQEELVAVIVGAGLTLSKADSGQLLAAIRALITSGGVTFATDAEAVAGAATTKAMTPRGAALLVLDRLGALVNGAPPALANLAGLAGAVGNNPNFAADVIAALSARALAARQIAAAGLATGGGTLLDDLTITVTPATGVELNAGTEAGKALTPAAFAAGGGGDGSSGWAPLPGGNMIQWGAVTVPGNNTSAVEFSIAFPRPFLNVCGSVVATAEPTSAAPSGWHPLVAMLNAPSIAGVTGWLDSTKDDRRITGVRTLRWQAVGR